LKIPLKALAPLVSADEAVVRDAAVTSMCGLIEGMSAEGVTVHVVPLLRVRYDQNCRVLAEDPRL
jgi:hypothetical protein